MAPVSALIEVMIYADFRPGFYVKLLIVVSFLVSVLIQPNFNLRPLSVQFKICLPSHLQTLIYQKLLIYSLVIYSIFFSRSGKNETPYLLNFIYFCLFLFHTFIVQFLHFYNAIIDHLMVFSGLCSFNMLS